MKKGLAIYIFGVYLNLKHTFRKQIKLFLLKTLIFRGIQHGKEKKKRKLTTGF